MVIDKEFKDLIPPLSVEEREQLETNIVGDGIRDPLVVWNDILLDGHNRYEIAQEYGITFDTVEMHFGSREEAKIWVIQNQLGRRNLSVWERAKLALKLKPEAKGKTPNTREAIADIAGVSSNTIHRAEYLEKNADEETLEKLDAGEISINKAFTETKPAETVAFDGIKGDPFEMKEEILKRMPEKESKLGLPHQKIAVNSIRDIINGDYQSAMDGVLKLLEEPTPVTMALAKILLEVMDA